MQVGLADAWLDRNDCSGTQLPPSPRAEEGSDSEERGMSLFLRHSIILHHPARTHTHAHTHVYFNSSLLRCLTQTLSKSSS